MTVKIDTDARIVRVRLQEQSATQTGTVAGYGFLFEKTDQQLYLWNASGTASNLYHMGAAFPGSPLTNELFYRTDRNILYFYDGTRWLSEELFTEQFMMNFVGGLFTGAGSTRIQIAPVWANTYDVWLVDWRFTTYVATTNNGSNNWTIALSKTDGTSTTNIVTPTTSADAADNYVTHVSTIGALLGTANDMLALDVTKNSAPGGLYVSAMVTYRLVG